MTENNQDIASIAAELIQESADRIFVLTPVVWRPLRGSRVWYFTMAFKSQTDGFVIDQVVGPPNDQQMVEEARADLRAGLVSRRIAVVLIDTDDEYEAAKICCARWPCDKTRNLLREMEAERAGQVGSA